MKPMISVMSQVKQRKTLFSLKLFFGSKIERNVNVCITFKIMKFIYVVGRTVQIYDIRSVVN